jgi:hypothetical protein
LSKNIRDEGYSLKERLGEREYLEKYVEFMPKSVLRHKTGVLIFRRLLHDKYYNTVEYRNWLEEMNTTSNRMADRYGEPLPEEPKPNWIKYRGNSYKQRRTIGNRKAKKQGL